MIIFEYKVDYVNEWFNLSLPQGSNPIAFQTKKHWFEGYHVESLFLWVLAPTEFTGCRDYSFNALGTGVSIDADDSAIYVATAQLLDEVYHLLYRRQLSLDNK